MNRQRERLSMMMEARLVSTVEEDLNFSAFSVSFSSVLCLMAFLSLTRSLGL